MYVKIKLLNERAKTPEYKTAGSAGADLFAWLPLGGRTRYQLNPGRRCVMRTMISLEIPVGYEGQIRTRSGLAAKNGIIVLNSPGTIDSDYRGEIKVILYNTGQLAYEIKHHDRIAQIIFNKIVQVDFIENELTKTKRGKGGLGSTGV